MPGERQLAQRGGSLGDRLCSAFEWAFQQPEGWTAVCVLGTDVPDLDGADLRGAFFLSTVSLQHHD